MYLKYILMLMLFALGSTLKLNLTNITENCAQWIDRHVFENKEFHIQTENKTLEENLIFIQFKEFTALTSQFECEKNFKLNFNNQLTENLLLNAEQKTLLEHNLNLTNILNMINFSLPSNIPLILVRNILGFNQYVNITKADKEMHRLANVDVYFNNVNFDFYLNNTLITRETCQKENFYSKQINYFWPMSNVFFNYDILYTRPVCPYIFLNSRLIHLGLFQITNSLIFKNRLEFINIDADMTTVKIGLNMHGLLELEINLIFEDLSEKNLCPHIFKSLKYLQIIGSLNQIQTNLFESYTQLDYVIFTIDNLKHLFHRVGIKWTLFLNATSSGLCKRKIKS